MVPWELRSAGMSLTSATDKLWDPERATSPSWNSDSSSVKCNETLILGGIVLGSTVRLL